MHEWAMMRVRIPIIKPTLVPFSHVEHELRDIWQTTLITTGKYTQKFEKAIQKRLGVKYAVAFSSATSALILAVKALNLKGEVILPSFTWTSTAHALVWNGVKPVFADCLPGTYCLDPEDVRKKITGQTSAVFPVHVFGLPADIDELRQVAKKNGLRLLFDAAQAIGATYKGKMIGGFGDCEVFSFSPTKVITSMEGGIVTTSNRLLFEKLQSMRDYGKSPDGTDIEHIGLSARITEVQSLVGWKNLEQLEKVMKRRQHLIAVYRKELKSIAGISFQHWPANRTSSGNYCAIFIGPSAQMSRDQLYDHLSRYGIQTKKYFHPAVHLQEAYKKLVGRLRLPVTELAASQGLALPLYGTMKEKQVRHVCQKIKKAMQ